MISRTLIESCLKRPIDREPILEKTTISSPFQKPSCKREVILPIVLRKKRQKETIQYEPIAFQDKSGNLSPTNGSSWIGSEL